jgi:hypothetical protein
MKKYLNIFFTIFLAFICFTDILYAQNPPEVKKISNSEYQIGNALINTAKGSVTLKGWVNMSEGLIELLACGPRGKKHESVLILDVEPYHLQVALLMLGLEPGGGLSFQGDPKTPKGDSLYVYVSWEKRDGNHMRVRGEDLVYNIKENKTMPQTEWVFSGSRFINNVFMASVEQSFITTFHDPNTIIDNPLTSGGDDTLYEVNKKLVPPVNTPVIIELIKK